MSISDGARITPGQTWNERDAKPPASSGTVGGVVGPRYCALCGEWPARETKNGLRCHLCECRDICVAHPVPMPCDNWKLEAMRLSDALRTIARNVEAGAVNVTWCGDFAKAILALPVAGNPVTANPSLQGTGHLVDRTLQGVVGGPNG